MYHDLFTSTQLLVSLIFLPIIMTVAEAFSPHTNDGINGVLFPLVNHELCVI